MYVYASRARRRQKPGKKGYRGAKAVDRGFLAETGPHRAEMETGTGWSAKDDVHREQHDDRDRTGSSARRRARPLGLARSSERCRNGSALRKSSSWNPEPSQALTASQKTVHQVASNPSRSTNRGTASSSRIRGPFPP